MEVTIFCNDKKTIVVGMNEDGSLVVPSDVLFGPSSGENVDDYKSRIVNLGEGQVVEILHHNDQRILSGLASQMNPEE